MDRLFKESLKINSNGFTLLELVIVVIILGILATLGFVQYTRTVEKSRTAEARSMLSTIRTAEHGYKQQFGSYTSDIGALAIDNAASNCPAANGTFFFSYSIDATSGIATRCSAAGTGKDPSGPGYNITLDYDLGTFVASDPAYN